MQARHDSERKSEEEQRERAAHEEREQLLEELRGMRADLRAALTALNR